MKQRGPEIRTQKHQGHCEEQPACLQSKLRTKTYGATWMRQSVTFTSASEDAALYALPGMCWDKISEERFVSPFPGEPADSGMD